MERAMTDVLDVIWRGLKDSFLMAWEVWWALILGFAISAIVQAWIPRERVQRALAGSGARPVALATGLGAASSSCSYAAIAIAKSLFEKGASSTTMLAFQFASTNIVWELGLVLWVLIGWQFTLAEYVGPLIAVLSFVCSVGNVPLAAVLWSGGISFAGVLAFLFADLIVLPIIAIYRKYYGGAFALRIVVLMFAAMALAALIVAGLFSALGLVPGGARPTRADVFGSVHVDYNLFLNVLAVAVFAALFGLTAWRGVTDPVCGMKIDRVAALRRDHLGGAYYFCSDTCRDEFDRDPGSFAGRDTAAGVARSRAPSSVR